MTTAANCAAGIGNEMPNTAVCSSMNRATHLEWTVRTLEWERVLSRLRAGRGVSAPRRDVA